jgi:predicted transcriptional regulator
MLTERESQIMEIVWRLGEASAERIREEMPGSPHDSTVRTLLRILESKSYLAHETRGKAYIYRAVVDQHKAQRLALKGLLARFFGGSAAHLVLRLIEDNQLTAEQLDELRQAAQPISRTRQQRKGEAP